jgi:spore germination protein GerM
LLLLLALVSVMTIRTLNRLPDTLVYFVRSEPTFLQLVAVGRKVAARTPKERLEAALQELIAGPPTPRRHEVWQARFWRIRAFTT